MTTKEIITDVINGFDTSDGELVTRHMADDVEWHLLGDKVYKGKEALLSFFENSTGMKVLSSITHHIIIDGDKVAVNGEVKCGGADGNFCNMYYSDVYELENDKIKKLTSYIVEKKDS